MHQYIRQNFDQNLQNYEINPTKNMDVVIAFVSLCQFSNQLKINVFVVSREGAHLDLTLYVYD